MNAIEFLGWGLDAWITIVTVLAMFSVLLILLSYASGMGGVCTLIGLLMNLIILAANRLIVNLVYPLTPLP